MSSSMRYTTIQQFTDIFNKIPSLGLKDLTEDTKYEFKLARVTTQKNYLDKLRQCGDATPEFISLAKKIAFRINTSRVRN